MPRHVVPQEVSLFDHAAAQQARDGAISQVEANAGDSWKAGALEAVYACAMAYDEFIVDLVYRFMPGHLSTLDGRAMGAVMLRARRNGWIERTGRFELTAQVKSHRQPRGVWRSLLREQWRRHGSTGPDDQPVG